FSGALPLRALPSFPTRRSSDLNLGFESASQVRVTTLHSLALRLLRAAGMLEAFPADPLVLDKWEVENVFDKEFERVQRGDPDLRSEEHTSELQSRSDLVCRLLL